MINNRKIAAAAMYNMLYRMGALTKQALADPKESIDLIDQILGEVHGDEYTDAQYKNMALKFDSLYKK